MDPPIHTDYIHAGGATTLIFIVNGANAISSFVMRSTISWNMAVPPGNAAWAHISLRIIVNPQLPDSICFFATDSSCSSISCATFLEESISHSSFLFEPDLPIDSHDKAPISEIRFLNWFHRGQYHHLFVPSFLCPFLPEPQTVFPELRFLLQHMETSPLRQSLRTFQISISFSSRNT